MVLTKPSHAALETAKQVVAIREKWHTKRHPFFQEMARGKLPIRAVGVSSSVAVPGSQKGAGGRRVEFVLAD